VTIIETSACVVFVNSCCLALSKHFLLCGLRASAADVKRDRSPARGSRTQVLAQSEHPRGGEFIGTFESVSQFACVLVETMMLQASLIAWHVLAGSPASAGKAEDKSGRDAKRQRRDEEVKELESKSGEWREVQHL
jgi:hypothetical protein